MAALPRVDGGSALTSLPFSSCELIHLHYRRARAPIRPEPCPSDPAQPFGRRHVARCQNSSPPIGGMSERFPGSRATYDCARRARTLPVRTVPVALAIPIQPSATTGLLLTCTRTFPPLLPLGSMKRGHLAPAETATCRPEHR